MKIEEIFMTFYFPGYDEKPYAKQHASYNGGPKEVTIDFADLYECYADDFFAVSGGNRSKEFCDSIVQTTEAMIERSEEDENTKRDGVFSDYQRECLSKMISDVFSYAYAKGTFEGVKEGMFSWDEFLGCPLDGDATTIEERAGMDIQFAELVRFEHSSINPYIRENAWVGIELRCDAKELRKFAESIGMPWQRCMNWIEEVRRIAQRHQDSSRYDDVKYRRALFIEMLYLFDLFNLDYFDGLRTWRCTCEFYRDKMNDSRCKSVNWDMISDSVSDIEMEAYLRGVPIEDIFRSDHFCQ